MRIVQLTPGTGNFHCGNCLRDQALVAALRADGHEATMLPMYLPMVTEREDASAGAPLFFGGVNVYLQQKSALFRLTPRWVDKMLDHGGLLRKASARAGMTKARELGELTVSMLRGESGKQHKEVRRLSDWLAGQPKPDVVCLSNALLIGVADKIRETLGVPIVCTLQGEDAFLDTLPDPYRQEAWDLLAERAQRIARFVGVSDYYGNVMRHRLGLPAERVAVVRNGMDLTGYEPAETDPETPTVGFLARMCEGKGLATATDAFIALKKRGTVPGVRFAVAGAQTPSDRAFVQTVETKLRDAGCAEDATFQANIDLATKQDFLRSLSVLSVPAMYGEAFGLYVIEAWAAGVPVVQPDHAAFTELLGASGGGILAPDGDPEHLADGLEQILLDHDKRRTMGRAGRRHVEEHLTIERMAQRVLDVYREAAEAA